MTLVDYLCTIPGWIVLAFLVWGVIGSGTASGNGSTLTNKDRIG